MPRALGIGVVLLILLSAVPPAAAQPATPPASDSLDTSLRVSSVRLAGDLGFFDDEALRELLRVRRNRRFLGIPGLTPSLWIYQLGQSMGGTVGRALVRSGEPPAELEPEFVEADRERLETLFRQEGYRSARVEADVDTLSPERARVTYRFDPGPVSQIASVRYEGLGALDERARQRIASGSILKLDGTRAADTLAFVVREQRFSESQLLEERRRLLALLRDAGYARVARDSIRAVVFEAGPLTYDVAFQVRTGPRYVFGDVRASVEGPEEEPKRTDTLQVGDGALRTTIEDERTLEPQLIARALRFEPGQPYRRSDLLATKRRLERTGVFAFSEIAPLPDVFLPGDSVRRLPHRIGLRTRQRHSLRFEGFVLQRTGLLAAEGGELGSDELGFGVGAAYQNANVFGGGEAFGVRLSGSVAGDFADFPTSQVETSASLTLPYLVPPFGFVERALRPFDTRTRFSVGFLAARRDELRLIVRGRASAGVRLEVQHTPTLASLVDLVDFDLSDPDTLSGFADEFLAFVDDPVAQAFILEDYTRPQVNNALRYTLRAVTADPFRRDRGYSRELAVEAGGNLPYLLDRWAFTPDTLEGSLPGLPVFGGSSRLEYRPYVRLVSDVREYRRLNRLTTLAAKAIVGVAHPTGDAPVVPFDRRFYAGGANSVRGWQLRELGPGKLEAAQGAFVQGGDIKLELGLELRTVLLRQLFAADWSLALFSDAGNVWFGPRNPGDPGGLFRLDSFYDELAVGAGTGLRVAWEFLIVRFDLAWQVHSPVPDEEFFPNGRRPIFHFGIGQAF